MRDHARRSARRRRRRASSASAAAASSCRPTSLLGFDGSDGAFGPIFCSCPISSRKFEPRAPAASRRRRRALAASPPGAEHVDQDPLNEASQDNAAAPPAGPGDHHRAPGAPPPALGAGAAAAEHAHHLLHRVVRVGRQAAGGRLLDLEERRAAGRRNLREARARRLRPREREEEEERGGHFSGRHLGDSQAAHLPGCQNGIDGKAAAQTVATLSPIAQPAAQQAR